MWQRRRNQISAVLLGGFAGLSCLVNLQAQDAFPPVSAICLENGHAAGNGPYAPPHGSILPCEEVGTGPLVYFQADYLFWTRNSDLQAGPVIGGPDTFGYDALDFGFDSGYRLRAAVAMQLFEFEISWASIDGWNDSLNGQLTTGLAFDNGAAFAGANFINNSTYFRPLFLASSANLPGADETLEDDGLGPVDVFADPAPTYQMEYRSRLQDLEVLAKYAPFGSRVKLGIGWRNVSLEELSRVAITGTYRAIDNDPGANGGLSHLALTDLTAGNLQHWGGAADGFDDETGLLGGGGPALLHLQNLATTENRLNGVQFAMEALLIEGERMLLDTTLKVGVYNNRMSGQVTETYSALANDNSVYGRALADNVSSVAFVGQVGLGTTYRINDYLRLRGGWEVMFISGVALAPDQRADIATNSYRLNTDGSLIANGGHIGLEFVY